MEENEELTGMHLFKKLKHQEQNGQGMSPDEWDWYKRKQKESEKYAGRLHSGSYNRDKIAGSDSEINKI